MTTMSISSYLSKTFRINIILLALVSITGCKDDQSLSDRASDEEKIYMEDFRPNPFKWGYINTSGRLAIPAVYEDNRDFTEGLAAVNIAGKWGYIDRRGEIVIPTIYRAVYPFSEGMAIVQDFDKRYFTIDTQGKEVHKGDYLEQHPYRSGRSRVKINDTYSYVNEDGIRIDSQSYLNATDYYGSYAVVELRDGYHIIDRSQKVITTQSYDRIYPSETHYWRYRKDGLHGYLYITDQIEDVMSDLDKAGEVLDGISCIRKGSSNYIYHVDDGRKVEIPYTSCRNLNHGRVVYKDKSKYGILDAEGGQVAPPIYDALYRYADHRIGYQRGDQWGFLDLNGKEVTPPIYPLVWDYHNGLARVITTNGIGFIDTLGRMVIPDKFVEVRDFYGGMARVQIFRQ